MINIKDRLPKNIEYYQINEIKLEPITLDLVLGIINPINPKEFFSINFKNLAYFSVSKAPDDIDGCFQIGYFKLSHYKDPHSSSELINCGLTTYPDLGEVYHLKIEGDIYIEVVSNSLILK